MTDRQALLAAVIADPDEDTPRLIYADWLDENGQAERAAFVRAQIDAVRADPFGVRARAAGERAERIRAVNHMLWTRHLRGAAVQAHFERGFVAGLEVEPQTFVPHAAALFAAEPVQTLKLSRSTPTPFDPVFELSQLRRVRRLEFTPGVLPTDEEFAGLAASPHLTGLRDLSFRGNPVSPAWLGEVLGGGTFPELAGLNVADIPNLGPGLVAALGRARHRDLRRLDASRVVLNSDQLQRLLTSPCLQRVEELRLGWFGRRGEAGPLFHLEFGWLVAWGRLVVLDVTGQRLGDEGVNQVVRTPGAAALRWLGLANNDLGREAVRLLIGSNYLNLNYLDLRENGFGDAERLALQHRFPEATIEVGEK